MQTQKQFPTGAAWERAKLEDNWLCFRVEHPGPNGKANKVPCNSQAGFDAATEKAAFLTFEKAVAAQRGLTGRIFEINARLAPEKQAQRFCVGYLAREGSALIGLDLDDVVRPDGTLAAWVPPLTESYTEVSASGTGLHILTERQPGDQRVTERNQAGVYAGPQRGMALTFDHVTGSPLTINGAAQARSAVMERLGDAGTQGKRSNPKNRIDIDLGIPSDRSAIPGILDSLPNPANGRDQWVRAAHACKACALDADADTALKIEQAFLAWSARGEAHGASGKSDSPQRLWNSITQCDGITPGTFYYIARELGWQGGAGGFNGGGGNAHTSDGKPRANDPQEFDLSHDALARDLGARFWDKDAKHVATWGRWFFWTGTRWEADDRLRHMTEVRDYVCKLAHELTAWAERKAEAEKTGDPKQDAKTAQGLSQWAKDHGQALRNKATVAAIADLARSNPASVACVEDFDSNLMLIGTPGGVVDLRAGTLRQARRNDMVTKLTACAPAAPGTQPERWLTFLHEIFNGDQDVIDFMQRAAGYALTGETREHKLLFLHGTGRNGKSVFLNTLMSIWGDYARRVPAATFLHSNTERHPTDIAGLHGARLAVASELPKGKTWDESTIKDLTGGDRLTARRMRQDFFDFDPQMTLMIAGNNMPSFRGVDEAIRARVVLVPFTVTIPPERRDTGLPDKLRAEAPAILRWAIDGALAWQRSGLDVPASIAAASAEYFDEEDTVAQFLADETRRDAMAFTTTTDLHQRFTYWCERQGLNTWTLRTLQKEMTARGWQVVRRNYGRGFLGLNLR